MQQLSNIVWLGTGMLIVACLCPNRRLMRRSGERCSALCRTMWGQGTPPRQQTCSRPTLLIWALLLPAESGMPPSSACQCWCCDLQVQICRAGLLHQATATLLNSCPAMKPSCPPWVTSLSCSPQRGCSSSVHLRAHAAAHIAEPRACMSLQPTSYTSDLDGMEFPRLAMTAAPEVS